MAAFPLLLIPFALLNILMFFVDGGLSQVWLSASLPSGGAFVLTAGCGRGDWPAVFVF